MKIIALIITAALSIGISYGQSHLSANDSLSYALGQDLASYLKRMEFPLNKAQLLKAIEDVLDDREPTFQPDEKDQIIRQGMQRLQNEKNDAQKNASEEFMQKQQSDPEVQSTPEGMHYKILQPGTGEKANIQDTVLVHYIGKLINGEVFDNSYERGAPQSLALNTVIEGWKIGIPLMNAGAKYRFFIPYHLGYGERGSGPIPPFSALIFDVELVDVKKADKKTEDDAI